MPTIGEERGGKENGGRRTEEGEDGGKEEKPSESCEGFECPVVTGECLSIVSCLLEMHIVC